MSTYEISKSSLLSLKAEILKKQEELNKAKLDNQTKVQREVKKGPLEFKSKGVESRQLNEVNSDEEDLLKKSRAALEAKSRLYDKLSKGCNDPEQHESNKRYLVHFEKKNKEHKKKVADFIEGHDEDDVDRYPESEEEEIPVNYSDYKADHSDDEWVEYTDCFGRTRTCLKKDLRTMKEKDSDIRPSGEMRSSEQHKETPDREDDEQRRSDSDSHNSDFGESSEMLSGDMRMELQRREWEKEEATLRDKKNIHYQDILFSEARSHGVGYYAFSKDEEEREKQQEALNKIRKETAEQQRVAQAIKSNREKQLKARVLAAKNRKRARMGLPTLTSDDEEEGKHKEPPKNDAVKEAPPVEDLQVEREKEAARRRHIRPWDAGKEGVKEHYEFSQKEWVDLQRKKRDDEFAPPRAYNSTNKAPHLPDEEVQKGLYFSSKKQSKEPYVSSGEFHVDTSRPPPNIRNPSKMFVNPYKSSDEELPPKAFNPCFNNSTFIATPIQDECVDDGDDEEVDEGLDRLMEDFHRIERSKRSGAEIAPPPTFEYYGPSASKRNKPVKPTSSMEDSVMEGLKFLREKVEKKSNR